jgi:hypothetical protein
MREPTMAALGTMNTNHGAATVMEKVQDPFQSEAAAVIQRVE